jgi:cell division protease FtsH
MGNASDTPKSAAIRRAIALVAAAAALLLLLGGAILPAPAPTKEVPYSELVEAVEKGRAAKAMVEPEQIVVELRGDAQRLVATRPPRTEDPRLLVALREHDVVVSAKPDGAPWWRSLISSFGPFLLLMLLLFVGATLTSGLARGGKPLTFGQSKAKVYDRSKENQTTFADVAGVDEAKAELLEVVRFLKEPARYRAVGARVPKGVLLVGPPGTGKTLLARAVAGESGVPFFTLSGSEFVEMFVGVGASRVRDLFEQAKERAPCIVFIDELDAVGKARSGAAGFVANEEREQTLNQLLVEMDGFDSDAGLVIMAATNRPEILDRALLRAGRFDRQVIVDRPDVRGRTAILDVHGRKVKLAPDVDLHIVAKRTPGMVGADLANVVNEAALASVRRDAVVVAARDFEEAIDRIQLGLKEGRVMTEEEKRRVAFHEAGHALVALSVEHSDPVHRVTIIPRSVGALGATLQLPAEERWLVTRDELCDRLCVLFGGRSAEELVCHDISTGAENDLEQASELARRMVLRFGMSDRLGAQTFGVPSGSRWVLEGSLERNYAEATARIIDEEVRRLLEHEHDRARVILESRRDALQAIAKELLARETIERAELESIVTKHPRRPPIRAASA